MLFLYIAVISCTSLNPISNGMIAYSPDYLDFGTTATYTCLEGYFLGEPRLGLASEMALALAAIGMVWLLSAQVSRPLLSFTVCKIYYLRNTSI